MADNKKDKGAKQIVVIICIIGAFVVSVLFCFALRLSLQTPIKIDPNVYDQNEPDGFVCQISYKQEGGALTVFGSAYISDSRITKADCFVVIKDDKSGEYYRLPTAMERDVPVAFSGIVSVVAERYVRDGNSIFLLYKNEIIKDGLQYYCNNLIDTGIKIKI